MHNALHHKKYESLSNWCIRITIFGYLSGMVLPGVLGGGSSTFGTFMTCNLIFLYCIAISVSLNHRVLSQFERRGPLLSSRFFRCRHFGSI